MRYAQIFLEARVMPASEGASLHTSLFLAQAQKAEDARHPVHERVGVGGHLIAYILQSDDAGVVTTTIFRCHEFPDYQEAFASACEKIAEAHARVGASP